MGTTNPTDPPLPPYRAEPVPPLPPTATTNDLPLKIHATIRDEIKEWIKEISNLTGYAAIGTGGVWSWVLTNVDKIKAAQLGPPATVTLLAMPVLVSLLFALRVFAIRQMILIGSAHCARIESAYGLDERLGWDSFWHGRHARRRGSFWVGELDGFLFLYWLLIVAINVTAACFVFRAVCS